MLTAATETVFTKQQLAGFKAAETRRRLAQERTKVEIKKHGTEAEAVADDGAVVEINLAPGVNLPKTSSLPTGIRRWVVIEVTKREARLFNPASLTTIKLDRYTFDKYAKPVRFNRRAVARIIRANIASNKELNLAGSKLSTGGTAAKAALAILKAPAPSKDEPAPLLTREA